ncbi:low molecular weight phosphatase family protein [Shimia sp. R10_1]|uniref:arsenate-mycothiol transferase ArsC n=1 Tax=Shimia sp. R10_1 TaxID=2821095 RepID=UPI001ADB8B11|nr:low molecular weight phosphatase family protein [Shimia sp. R10_1]MBO9474115.1 low molecular weight phosphatase family protein [Shimia sp. R10_1]
MATSDDKCPLPQSVLFCCDQNAVRSPMAEGIMKKFYGLDVYVQSAGIRSDLDIDGFAIAVCDEIGVELARHRTRSFEEMEKLGDDLSSFDMVVALTPASRSEAEKLTRFDHLELEFWPVTDPTGVAAGDGRDAKLAAYRIARDEIVAYLQTRWGASPL